MTRVMKAARALLLLLAVHLVPFDASIVSIVVVSAQQQQSAPSEVTLADLLQSSDHFSVFLSALKRRAPELLEALAVPDREYTVFAPTNKAFGLTQAQARALLSTPEEDVCTDPKLNDLLYQHVTLAKSTTDDFVEGLRLNPLLSRGTLRVGLDEATGLTMVNNVSIELPNVAAGNGIMHVVNSLLVLEGSNMQSPPPTRWYYNCNDPPAATIGSGVVSAADDAPLATLGDKLTKTERLSLLAQALQASPSQPELGDLVEALFNQSSSKFTVFAPNNEAWSRLRNSLGVTQTELMGLSTLPEILQYHVVPREMVLYGKLPQGERSLKSAQGENVTINVPDQTINEARMTEVDITAANGVVHIIDTVLLPPSMQLKEPAPVEINQNNNTTPGGFLTEELIPSPSPSPTPPRRTSLGSRLTTFWNGLVNGVTGIIDTFTNFLGF